MVRGKNLFVLCCAMMGVWTAVSAAAPVQFVDRAKALGIDMVNTSGATQEYIVEGMMGGAAFFDYDADGDVDLYITNGSSFAGFAAGQHPQNRLYRNDGDLFVDVTERAVVGDTSWSMGSAAADYDNDGQVDLYVTNFGRNTLYRNRGDGRFADATAVAGVGHRGWGTGVTFGDYDRDGDVDLYVANYVDFSLDYESPIPCLWKNVKVYCGPVGLLPGADVFYENQGDGTFVERGEELGLAGEAHYGMTAIFGDYDADGWQDIFVANDSTPNKLFRNMAGVGFEEVALMAGVAYNGEGVTQGCMGAAMADYDNDGLADIFVTNFADENNALYKNDGGGFFSDVSYQAKIASADSRHVAWGTVFIDYDNDGDRDLFVANGHTYPQADLPGLAASYNEGNQLYENLGAGDFTEVSDRLGPGLALSGVSRGASMADYDSDGDVDLFVLELNGPPRLLRNDGGNAGNYLLIDTIGTRSNRDGIGTRIELEVGGLKQYAEVRSGGSYLSMNDRRVHFGLGAAQRVERIELHWPSGAVQILRDVAANQVLQVREPE
jgi:hypothetical protein